MTPYEEAAARGQGGEGEAFARGRSSQNDTTAIARTTPSWGATSIVCEQFKEHEKNRLRGFASLRLPSGLTIHGCGLHQKAGKRWISSPAQAYKTPDGTARWVPVFEVPDRARLAVFQHKALDAVDRYLAGGAS